MAIHMNPFTTPPSFSQRPTYPPKFCKSENRKNYYTRSSSPSPDCFHVIYKVPSGDSPYVRAKRVQLIDKEPSKAIPLFWRAINTGDRVDSALKDMAVVMKQLDRSDEAIEAITSFRHLCSYDAQESLDNILIEMYKRSGRLEEEIEMLKQKVKRIEEDESIGGKSKKMARSQGKKVYITVEQEYSRLLGNLAWAHLQKNDYKLAAEYYRNGLSIEPDRNKQCNLAICLMHLNRPSEAKMLLNTIEKLAANQPMDESYAKSYERAYEMLDQIESQGGLGSFMKGKENHSEQERDFDCQSQLDYIDNMCAVGDATNSGSKLTTPVVTKSKTGAPYTDGSLPDSVQKASEQHLFTQPIYRKQNRARQAAAPLSVRRDLRSSYTQPKRYPVILGCGAKEKELNRDSATSQPCNLQYRKDALVFGNFEAPSTDGSEVTTQRPYSNSEKSSAGSPNECYTDQHSSDGAQKNWQPGLLRRDPNDKNVWKSPSTVQPAEISDSCKAKDFPFLTWSSKSGKSWADMAEEEEEEDSLNYNSSDDLGSQVVSPRAHLSSKSSSVRRSLSYDHEKQNASNCASTPPIPKALTPSNCASRNASWSSNRKSNRTQPTEESRRLPVFRDITPGAEIPRA